MLAHYVTAQTAPGSSDSAGCFSPMKKSAGAAIRPRQRIEPAEKTVNSAGMLLLGETHVTLTAHLRLNAWRPLLYSPSCSQSKMIVSSGENTMNRNVIIGIIVLAIIILAVIFFMPGTAETPPGD
ncbi:hypothetical protein Q1M63_14080 (plasmid) [Sinorhizobium meliloti]|nr:hypothetical protein Q1M63_14080 [Sinorhizobium meliloti]